MNQAYSRLSTTHGHITDCKLLCMYGTRRVLVRPTSVWNPADPHRPRQKELQEKNYIYRDTTSASNTAQHFQENEVVLSQFNGTSTPKGSYSAKTGDNDCNVNSVATV